MPAGDEEAMANRVKTLLEDKTLRESMSKMGREETERWSWEAATSVLRNVQYQKVKGLRFAGHVSCRWCSQTAFLSFFRLFLTFVSR